MSQLVITRADDLEAQASQTLQGSVSEGLLFGDSVSGVEPGSWQLDTGHYEPAIFAQHVIYPRPDVETNSYARHRWAMPDMIYEVPIGVRGGAWPYRYQMTSGPAWLDIQEETLTVSGDVQVAGSGYGLLRGTAPSSGGPWSVTVRVTDQDGATLDLTWQITLDATQFVHVDFATGNDSTGDGTAGSPYKTVEGVKAAGTHGDEICVVHGTAYTMDWNTSGDATRFDCGTNAGDPMAYINDPADGVCVIEATTARKWGDPGKDDALWYGFRVNNCHQTTATPLDNVRIIRGQGTDRVTIANVHFDNPDEGTVGGGNTGCVFFPAEVSEHQYIYLWRCKLTNSGATGNGFHLYDGYGVNHYLIEHCECYDGVAWESAIWPKDINKNGTIRACHAHGIKFGAQGSDSKNNEVCWNRVVGPSGTGNVALHYNYGLFAMDGDENVFFYRNSVEWNASNSGDTPDPDVEIINCVVSGEVFNEWTAETGNVETGDQTTSAFDASMNLSGTYRTNYLGIKGAEVA